MNIWRFLTSRKRYRSRVYEDIQPDEIFLDSSNLPEFDVHQFEGRIIQPISKLSILLLGVFFAIVVSVFLWRVAVLQIVHGEEYASISEDNRLAHTYLFPERGVVLGRNGEPLAWNIPAEPGVTSDFSKRAYTDIPGIAHVLGYVKYPQADSSGNYYKTEYSGEAGVEKAYNEILNGKVGLKIIERDALLNVKSESVIDPPVDGDDTQLTIDPKLQSQMYTFIKELVYDRGFAGGTGIIMDVNTGEILALTNYPEYDPAVMSDGSDTAAIARYNQDEATPYLNRAISGRYTPGSIVKPFFAIAALNEGVITPEKQILSTGKLVVQNPWDPTKSTVFKDWKAHGWVNMRDALAVSSDVYFYEIGGGFEPDNQKGLGIERLEKYARMFGIGEMTGIDLPGEVDGVVPNPAWKAENFDGEDWLIGNTYHTSIGQYGFQVTPIQMVRAIGAIATDGKLVTPHVVKTTETLPTYVTGIDPYYYRVVREGMRQAVTEGTALGLNVSYLNIAAKSGTAEVGTTKARVNSWILGFYPYEEPKYAFIVMMEKGSRTNTVGGLFVMRKLFDWMYTDAPEYLEEVR